MRHILLLASTLLLAAPAPADTLQTFNLTATIVDRNLQTGTVAGTVELDTTTGIFVNGDFKIAYLGAQYLFDTTVSTFGNPRSAPTVILGVFDDTAGGIFQLGIAASSLIGYNGSAICVTVAPCTVPGGSLTSGFLAIVPGNNFIPALSGTLTPAVTTTPEPSTLLLLGTGALGLACIVMGKCASERLPCHRSRVDVYPAAYS